MKRHFCNIFGKIFSKLKYKITLVIVVCIVVPVISMNLFISYFVNEFVQEKTKSIIDENFQLSQSNASYVFDAYQKLIYQMVTDELLLGYVRDLRRERVGTSLYLEAQRNAGERINTIMLTLPEIHAIGIAVSPTEHFVAFQKRQDRPFVSAYFAEHVEEIFTTTTASSDSLVRTIPSPDNETGIFSINHRMVDHSSLSVLGSISIFIEPQVIEQAINNKDNETAAFCDKLILTAENQPLYTRSFATTAPEEIIGMLLQAPEPRFFFNENIFVNSGSIGSFDLKLVDIIYYDIMLREINQMGMFFFLIVALVAVFSLVLGATLARSIVRPIENLSRKMDSWNEQNMVIAVPEQTGNQEIDLMSRAFNQLIQRTQNLHEENNLQHQRILTIQKQSSEAQLKSLELQINPHFLFNTIDSINWLALRQGSFDVSEKLGDLAFILRHTVYNINTDVPLSREVEWLHHYLTLQKVRFSSKFDYTITVAPEATDYLLHKMLLQPFVENVIIHGFEKIDYLGVLSVDIDLREQTLYITIVDNGCGISQEEVLRINNLFQFRFEEQAGWGIGLTNVAYRLYAYYGTGAQVQLTSRPGTTCFEIAINKINEEE